MTVLLAIESSCDETSAAVVENGTVLHSNVVASQIPLHERHGGVIPELAARAHLEQIGDVVARAMEPLDGDFSSLDGVAVTRGPGLAGCLLVGCRYAQGIASAAKLPLIGVSHLAGHVYSAALAYPDLEPPFLALVVSGGHTDSVLLPRHREAIHLAGTRDDAVGEAFDKVGRLLSLPYPGGPAIEKAAVAGNASRFSFPVTGLADGFSYSGLKTSVRHAVEHLPESAKTGAGVPADPQDVADLAASFQKAAIAQLIRHLERMVDVHRPRALAVVGGVAANGALRKEVTGTFTTMPVCIPPIRLCTDNAGMIGAAAFHHLDDGEKTYALDVDPGLLEFA